MKQLLLSAIRLRLQLMRTNRGYVHGVEQTCKELLYWINNGADIERLVQRRDVEIRAILTPNYMKKYEQLKLQR